MEWISVEKALPKEDEKYLVKRQNGDQVHCHFMPDKISWISFYGQKTSYWMHAKSGELVHDVIEWMPRQESPKE